MTDQNFKTGYRVNYLFYIMDCLIVILMHLAFHRLNEIVFYIFLAYTVITMAILFREHKKPRISEYVHKRLQVIFVVIVNGCQAFAFDSAQVFIYAMCFSAVVVFVFLDEKLSRFYTIMSVLIVITTMRGIVYFIHSINTTYAFSFGILVLVVINWIIITMVNRITFQTRQNIEQERSLDDMLKVVEAKCDEAQNATRSKTQFLANMSHEIRTPINSIMGMNEMILRESTEPDIRDYAGEVKTASQSLLGIINDILDISKIEAGKYSIVRVKFNLATLIGDVYNLVRFRAEGKNLEFKVIADEDLPSRIYADDIRLKQILMNLLTNAVKYTDKGTITFRISLADGGGIRFAVKDTGIGIKEKDLVHLHIAFNRLDEKRNRKVEGTGLGLAITTGLLELMGSKLEVSSVYGEGSVFSFVIKPKVIDVTPIGWIDFTQRNYKVETYNEEFEAPDAHVLIVDDNDVNRKVFIKLLKKTKIKISEASSGAECLAMTAETRYDMIFMDHMMPEMDGIQAFKAIRSQEMNLCRTVPIIALTANAVSGAREYYLDIGFNGFLTKPVEPKQLEDVVRTHLDSRYIKQCTEPEPEPEIPPLELPIIEGVDWSVARLHLKDDDILLETLTMFSAALRRDADELDFYYEDIKNEDSRTRYRVKVHSMKSSAMLVGFVQLAGMAMELEKAARAGEVDIIKAMHKIFIERWMSYSEPLAEIVESSTPKIPAAGHMAEIEEIFAQIRTAAEEMDVDVLDDMSSRLNQYSFESPQAEQIESIRASILNFEVEKLTDVYLQ